MQRCGLFALCFAPVLLGATLPLASPPLVVDALRGRTLVLVTARGFATVAAREADLTIVAGARDARRVAHALPRYDATTSWMMTPPRFAQAGRGIRDATTLDPTKTQFSLVVAHPERARFAAFVDHLETRFVREHLDAQVWSIVDGLDDCAALAERAANAARAAATRDARNVAAAAGLGLREPVASADATVARPDSGAARSCELGRSVVPYRRSNFSALTDSTGRSTASARIAAAFAASGRAALPPASRSERNDPPAAPLAVIPESATRLRVDAERIGPTITVIGTSARLRRPPIVRYSWTSARGRYDARATTFALGAAVRRLQQLGIPRSAIATRVHSGPTYPVNLFVDVPLATRVSANEIARAIGGDDASIVAAVGETFVRGNCGAFDERLARGAVASARLRAADLARALGTTLGAPLAYATQGVFAQPCSRAAGYAAAPPRGTIVGGPQWLPEIATYGALAATYKLGGAPRLTDAPPSRARPPATYALVPPQAQVLPVDVVSRRPRALLADGSATSYAPARSAELNITIAADRAHRFVSVDPRRAYALVAPLERRNGRAPARVVVRPSLARAQVNDVALHLDLRAPFDRETLLRLRTLLSAAGKLGAAGVQLIFATPQTDALETRLRRAALGDALRAARRDALEQHARLGPVLAVEEPATFVEHASVANPRGPFAQRIAVVARIRVIYALR